LAGEIIVVEGKDDAAIVKKASGAEVIITNGLGINQTTIRLIRAAQQRCGVIVLTDPDHPGEKIRRIISEQVPGCRHAFIGQQTRGRIGVEYSSEEEIRNALKAAHYSKKISQEEFTMHDLVEHQLVGQPNSAGRRSEVGKYLGIGETNGKMFLKRLNAFCITRQEFEKALEALGGE